MLEKTESKRIELSEYLNEVVNKKDDQGNSLIDIPDDMKSELSIKYN